MSEIRVRVAYVGNQRFIPARDEEQARAIAARLKTSGKVDLIRPL